MTVFLPAFALCMSPVAAGCVAAVYCRLRDRRRLRAAFRPHRTDHVVHLPAPPEAWPVWIRIAGDSA